MEWLRFIWVLECTAAAGRRKRDSTHPQDSPVLGAGPSCEGRNWATVQPLCSFASSGLSQSPSTNRISPTWDHTAKGLPGCSSALVKRDLRPHHTPNLFSSPAGTPVLLFCYRRRAGGRSQVGSGLPAYHWNLFLQHTNLIAQHCLQSRKKKAPLIALISSAIQGWHSLQQKDVSLPTLLTLMSCFLCNWLSQTAHVC